MQTLRYTATILGALGIVILMLFLMSRFMGA